MPAEQTTSDQVRPGQPDWLSQHKFGLHMSEQGRLVSIGDGIAWIKGLPSAAIDEILEMEDGSRALVFHLEEELLGAIVLQQGSALSAGSSAYHSGMRLSIGVGKGLLGRVVDPIGMPLDGQGPVDFEGYRDIDVMSPSIVTRDFVNRPLYTGNKIIDTMIPVGKGQRQLIIGDNGVGKSSIALDAVLNQKGKGVYCVYVAIGQKRSSVISTIEVLRESGAMDYTTVVVAEATAVSGLKYLAPFAGCAVAEHWMWQGKDALIVYDDLTAHAHAYRELSLLLRRPPGREAYPGDIFYLHSRLLERSTHLARLHGGGSMTALPIVETEQGEIASYIPTNLISITDGQVYLDQSLFANGILPAIDVTKSVSRIGGKAQHSRVKDESGRMKLDYLQFLELEVFTRFGSQLEASMENKIRRGRILRELLKQDTRMPLSAEFQLAWMIAYNEGLFDNVQSHDIPDRLAKLNSFVSESVLTLEDGRRDWQNAVVAWMSEMTTA